MPTNCSHNYPGPSRNHSPILAGELRIPSRTRLEADSVCAGAIATGLPEDRLPRNLQLPLPPPPEFAALHEANRGQGMDSKILAQVLDPVVSRAPGRLGKLKSAPCLTSYLESSSAKKPQYSHKHHAPPNAPHRYSITHPSCAS